MIPQLETQRLILRPLELDDAERTQLLFPHWDIVKHLAARFPWPYPSDGALIYYRDDALPAMSRGDEWHWTLRLKTDPAQHIGCISLFKGETGNRGFWLGLPWHRQGLMTEAVDTVNDFWFNRLSFQRERLHIRPTPHRSLGHHRRRMAPPPHLLEMSRHSGVAQRSPDAKTNPAVRF